MEVITFLSLVICNIVGERDR